MDLTSNHLLLYKSKRHQLERFEDYVERIAYFNGFFSVQSFKKFLKRECPSPKYNKFNAKYPSVRQPIYVARLADVLNTTIEFLDIDSISSLYEFRETERKICLICFQKLKVIFFYWYFKDYDCCHLCSVPLTFIQNHYGIRLGFKLDNSSVSNQALGVLESAVERCLNSPDPLHFLANELAFKNECKWFCVSLRGFFDAYGWKLNVIDENLVIEDPSFIELDINARYESIIDLLFMGSGIDIYRFRLISALTLLGQWDRDELVSLGQYKHAPKQITLDSQNWAIEQLLIYDWSKYLARYEGRNGYIPFIRFKDYVDGFEWLNRSHDRCITRILYRQQYSLQKAISFIGTSNVGYQEDRTADII